MSIQKHKYEYPYETKINLLRDSIVPLRLTQPSPFYCRPIICPLGQYISELYDWILAEYAAQSTDYQQRYGTPPTAQDIFHGGSETTLLPPTLYAYFCCYPRELISQNSSVQTSNILKTTHNTKYIKHDNAYNDSLIAYRLDYTKGGVIPNSCFSHILSYMNDIKTAYCALTKSDGTKFVGSASFNGYAYPFLWFVQDICGLKSTNIFSSGYGSFGYGSVIPYYGDLQKLTKNEQYLDSFLNSARPTYPAFVISSDASLLFFDMFMAKAYGETNNETIQGRLFLLDTTNKVIDNVIGVTSSCSNIAGTRYKNTQYAFLCSGSKQAGLGNSSGSQSGKIVVTNYQFQPIYESKTMDIAKLINVTITYYNPVTPEFTLSPSINIRMTAEFINSDGYYCTYESSTDTLTTYNNISLRFGAATTELLILDGNIVTPFKPYSGYASAGGYYSSPLASGKSYQYSSVSNNEDITNTVSSDKLKSIIQAYGITQSSNIMTSMFFYLTNDGGPCLYGIDNFSTDSYSRIVTSTGTEIVYPELFTNFAKTSDGSDFNFRKQNFVPYNTRKIAKIINTDYLEAGLNLGTNLTFCLEPNHIIDTGNITVKKQFLPETSCIYIDWKGYAEPMPNNYDPNISSLFTTVQGTADYGFVETLLNFSNTIYTRNYGPNKFSIDDEPPATSNVSGDNGQPSNNSYSVNLNDYDRHKLKITRVVKDIDSTYGSSDYSTKLQKQFNEKRFMPDTEHFVRVWTGTLPKNNTFRYNSNGALTSPIINTYVKLILEPYDTWNIYISDTTALSIEGYEAYNQDKNNFAEPFNITKGEMLLYGKKVGNYRLRIQQPLTELNNQPYSYGTSVNFDISIWDVLGFNNTAKKGSKINVGITGNSAGPHKWISSDPNIAIISDHPQDRTNDKKKQVDFIGKGTVFFWVIDQAGIPWCSKEITVS